VTLFVPTVTGSELSIVKRRRPHFLFVQLVGHLTLNQEIEFRILGGERLCSPMVEATGLEPVQRRFDPSHKY
jgi:hypothetical protein